MAQIRILPKQLKNKIAAGEVVERPASVLKELLENSIDAGATRLEVEVKKGGRALIRVTDNGTGMDEEDARLSIERHATSKLGSEEDLFNIQTMGFRGEALPSIASVSRMGITTALKDVGHGMALEIEGGEIVNSKAAPASGTMIEVRDLFFNTPARRKFLKRDATELMHIVETLTQLSLSHPSIGFSLLSDGNPTLDMPPASSLKERIAQVYGMEFVEDLMAVKHHDSGLGIEAYVSKPSAIRERRTHQYLFVNNRPIKDPSIAHAIYGSYDSLAPRDKHPVFFAFLTIPPSEVDFNVHPAKKEVRLEHKDTVYRFVRHAVTEVLRTPKIEEALSRHTDSGTAPSTAGIPQGTASESTSGPEFTGHENIVASLVSEPLPMSYMSGIPHIYLGESFLAYPGEDGLVVLDHHAAHERVLYERLLKGISAESHMLLFPRQLQLSHKEYLGLLEHTDTLQEFGISLEDFGQDTVIVRSLPPELEEADLRGILADAASAIGEGEKPGRSMIDSMAASIACHSSVRGSRVLSNEELGALIRDLEMADDPEHCPHGRPTRLYYTKRDLRKAFKRS